MKNTYTTPADFWQVRDFGAKISAVFEFIGAHWRRLGKCLVYFVLPGALLLGIGLGLLMNSVWNRMGVSLQKARLQTPSGSGYQAGAHFDVQGLGLAFVGGLLAMLLLLGTVYGYVRARLHLPADEPVTPAAVWVAMRSRFWRMALVLLLVLLAYIPLMLGMTAITGFATMATGVGGVALGFLFILLAGPVLVYLGIVLSFYFSVLCLENKGIFSAISRCYQLIWGKWWSTFGLLLVACLIQGVMSIVFALPQYAVMMGKMLQLPSLSADVLGLIAQVIYSVGVLFTYCIPVLALAFQYFNLVEQREGYGLSLLIGELGQSQAVPTAASHHYHPEEEQY